MVHPLSPIGTFINREKMKGIRQWRSVRDLSDSGGKPEETKGLRKGVCRKVTPVGLTSHEGRLYYPTIIYEGYRLSFSSLRGSMLT